MPVTCWNLTRAAPTLNSTIQLFLPLSTTRSTPPKSLSIARAVSRQFLDCSSLRARCSSTISTFLVCRLKFRSFLDRRDNSAPKINNAKLFGDIYIFLADTVPRILPHSSRELFWIANKIHVTRSSGVSLLYNARTLTKPAVGGCGR